MKAADGTPVVHFERIDSTNAEARRLAEAGERGLLWLVADEQTAGRGRLGRSWVSEPGNLHATLLLPAPTLLVASQLSLVAAVAVHDTVAALLPDAGIRIKWPNDVLISGAKVCGLLAEVVHAAPVMVAIGCGLNIAHAPAGTPYPATALAQHGVTTPLHGVFARLSGNLSARLRQWDEGRGLAGMVEAWRGRALGLGGAVSVNNGGRLLSGRFADIGPDGALLLEQGSGGLTSIHAGDVRFAELEQLRKSLT